MDEKTKLSDYTEHQFMKFIEAILDAETESQRDELLYHFKTVVPHPASTDLLFYPEDGADDSAEGVVRTIQEWCLANGHPGFKPRF
ncbi:colicin transporter [Pseudomonas syringae]|uniref:Colicin transporter n=1 Tax=Pseudomonas syringae TaxID=317 RepID=A0A1C7YYR4_PSESX|nr:bacteriocin immunity protein [Pseudomonas syringae]OCR22811.1 colicin transporter [Pseudomonas syringae]